MEKKKITLRIKTTNEPNMNCSLNDDQQVPSIIDQSISDKDQLLAPETLPITIKKQSNDRDDPRSNIYVFVQIPYHINTNISDVLELFVTQIPKERRDQIHISLLPNASIFIKRDFLFTRSSEKLALVEKLDETRFLVRQVYNKTKKVSRKILYVGRELTFKKEEEYDDFDPVYNGDHYLYDDKHQRLATVSKIKPQQGMIEWKHRWLVKQVDVSVENKKIRINKSVLSKNKVLEWKNGPTKYYFLPCLKHDEFVNIRKLNTKKYTEHCQKIFKYYSEFKSVSHLALYEWFREDANGKTKDIPYGKFRQQLVENSKDLLNEIYDKKQYAYIMTFDPDCRDLFVKDRFNIFDMYIHQIITNNYPYLLTSGYTFDKLSPTLNRIYRLNYEMQLILHKYLPGSAYFSECNSLIRYEWNLFNDKEFEFSPYHNEILPLVKYLAKNKYKMILIDNYPIKTTVPTRILKQMDQELQKNVLTKQHYISLMNLSQTLIHTQSFIHALISALSISIKDNTILKINIANLWKLHSPLSVENLDKKLSSTKYISLLEKLCIEYDQCHSITNDEYFEKLETKRNEIKKSIVPKFAKDKINADELTEICIKVCQECGLLCAHRVLQWIKHDISIN